MIDLTTLLIALIPLLAGALAWCWWDAEKINREIRGK